MQIRFDEHDFEKLYVNSTPWTPELAAYDVWEFEASSDPDRSQDSNRAKWSFGYWVPQWTQVILMRSWLDEQSHLYDIMWDTAEDEYVILTDYASPTWRAYRLRGAGPEGDRSGPH